MIKINWKVRFKSKVFVLSLLSLLFLLVQQLLAVVGIQWDYTVLNEQLTQIVQTVFLLLALVGVVKDPTTAGLSDSEQALTYSQPKKEEANHGTSD